MCEVENLYDPELLCVVTLTVPLSCRTFTFDETLILRLLRSAILVLRICRRCLLSSVIRTQSRDIRRGRAGARGQHGHKTGTKVI